MRDIDKRGQLKQLIEAYLKAHPYQSVNSLASRANCSPQTIWNLVNGDTKRPSVRVLVKVLGALHPGESLLEISNKYHGNIKQSLAKFAEKITANKKAKYLPEEMADAFASPTKFQIMLLAFSKKGTTRSEVQKFLGDKGSFELTKLLRKKILVEKEGFIQGLSDSVTMDQESIRQLFINSLSSCYQVDGYVRGENWLSFQSESVKREVVLPQVNKVLRKAFKDIQNILDAPENKGADVLVCGMMADGLFPKPQVILKKDE